MCKLESDDFHLSLLNILYLFDNANICLANTLSLKSCFIARRVRGQREALQWSVVLSCATLFSFFWLTEVCTRSLLFGHWICIFAYMIDSSQEGQMKWHLQYRRGSRILVRGSPVEFWPQGGALSPQFAQNKGFPLKLPENCMILKKSGARGAQAPRAPWIRHCNTHTHTWTHVISFLSSLLFSTSFFEARKAGKSWKHSKGPWKRLRWRSFAVWRDVSTSDQTGGAQVPQTDEDALRLVFLPSSLEFWRSHTTNAPAWQNQGKNL